MTTQLLIGDAFGRALLAHHRGEDGTHLVVRDDGYRHVADADRYFGDLASWSEAEAAAFERVQGRVLDIGGGAGRVALAAAERGLEARSIDTSPGAVEVARMRGADAEVATIYTLSAGEWDTVILFGSNLGLMRDADEAPRFLSEVRSRVTTDAVLLASSRDPVRTDNEHHLAYHAANVANGKMPGQVTIRVEFDGVATDWFDWLYVSPDELRAILPGTGWVLVDSYDEGKDLWVAVLKAE